MAVAGKSMWKSRLDLDQKIFLRQIGRICYNGRRPGATKAGDGLPPGCVTGVEKGGGLSMDSPESGTGVIARSTAVKLVVEREFGT